MKRTLLLALALCGASGAHAAAPLTADETLAAYCVGVAQVRVLAYEHMAASPCGPDVAQCRAVRQLASAAVPRLRREPQAANATLAAYRPPRRRPPSPIPRRPLAAGRRGGGGGEREALLCLNLRVPGLADPGAGDIGASCRRVAARALSPVS